MIRIMKIYFTCARISLRSTAAYRADFILSLLITLSYNILFPLVSVLIYASGQSFPGWSFYETLLMHSVFMLSGGITDMLMGSVFYATNSYVRSGSFETVLLKPMSALVYIISSTFSVNSTGVVLGSIAIMCISLCNVEAVSIFGWVTFLLLFVSGVLVMSGLSVLMAAISFKWVGNSRLTEIMDSIKNFGKYPLTIFPNAIKAAVTFVLPVGMISFYPASALLGTTFILTTHDLEDVSRLAGHIIIINHGEKIYDNDIDALKKSLGNIKLVSLTLNKSGEIPDNLEIVEKHGDTKLTLKADLDKTSIREITAALAQSLDFSDVSIKELPMEQIITKLYEE